MYDLIIIGSGPAGLTAGIYASCYRLKHLIIGQNFGGQLNLATHILNYPGFINISGQELVEKIVNQAKTVGCQLLKQEVISLRQIQPQGFEVQTKDNHYYSAQAVILATGTERKKLNVPGELKYTGKGVYYCAICQPSVYQNKNIVVVGGGNSAFQTAAQLIDQVKKLILLIRSTRIVAEPIWVEKIQNHPKVKILFNTQIQEIKGEELIKEIVINEDGQVKILSVDALFVEIGGVPGTALVLPLGIKIDQKGFLEVDHKLQTSIPGIFAAGDIVGDELSLEQAATAIGLGARAAASAYLYLKKQKAPVVWGEAEIRRN